MSLEAFINGDKQKKAKKRGRTVRFDLDLAPPTEDSTNEFSYTELVEGKEKKGTGPPPPGKTPEQITDNQLAALAQRLEQKYGGSSSSVKKRKRQRVFESDLIDRGYGYDTNDSFVDDSEMYEDFVPPQVDTQLGGFYVNTGNLEFKTVWPGGTEEDEDMDSLMKKKKKPKMKKQPSHQTPQSILASQKLKKARQHVVAAQKVPKPKAGKVLFKTSSFVSPAFAKSPHKKPMFKKKEKGQLLQAQTPAPVPSIQPVVDTVKGLSVEKMEIEGGEQGGKKGGEGPDIPKPPPVLPGDLPEGISSSIKQFEESVARDQASTPEGKMSVKLRGSYDEQLTELELSCRKLPLKKRIAVLEFVSHKLGVSRATTIKRVRQVMKKREEEALAQPLKKLKDAINASMTEQLQQYEQELKARAESLSVSTTGDKCVSGQVTVTPMEVEEEVTVDEVFEDSSNPTSEVKEASAKAKRAPRKKYKWTEEVKYLLCEVVRLKVESEEMIKGRTNGEEALLEFLDVRVKPFWPKGWMQKSVLYKLTEPVHRHFTNPQLKKAGNSATKKVDKDKAMEQKKAITPSPQIVSAGTNTVSDKQDNSASPGLLPRALAPPSAPGPGPSQQSPLSSESNSPLSLSQQENLESIQWSVKSTTTPTGSPITIVRKTAVSGTKTSSGKGSGGTTSVVKSSVAKGVGKVSGLSTPGGKIGGVAATTGTKGSSDPNSVQITPRMAQLLSSVASSQALVKPTVSTLSSKSVSSTTSSSFSSSSSSSSISTSSSGQQSKSKPVLHSEVQALLSQFQSPQAKFSKIITPTGTNLSPSSLIQGSPHVVSTQSLPPGTSFSNPSAPPLPSSSSSSSLFVGKGSSTKWNSSGSKLTGPGSKITTSPIQMKTIVSQMKPKSQVPHAKPTPMITTTVTPHQQQPSPPSRSSFSSHAKISPAAASGQKVSSSSSLLSTNMGQQIKTKKLMAVTCTSGPTIQLPKITNSFSLASNPQSKSGASVTTDGRYSSSKPPEKKRSSPSKAAHGENVVKSRLQSSPPSGKRQDHQLIQRKIPVSPSRVVYSSSPPSSTSSPSSSSSPLSLSSSSPQPLLPPSSIVQQGSPSYRPSSSSFSSSSASSLSTGSTSNNKTIDNKQQSTGPGSTGLEGTPITAILLQQPQPTYVVSNPPQLVMAQRSELSVPVPPVEQPQFAAVTTIPFSSCASTFILTSPLSGSHFGQSTASNTTPPLAHQLHQHRHQTPPTHRPLTITPPTIPVAGAQVVVAGVTGTGIKSPVEQIYLEHSYGGGGGGGGGGQSGGQEPSWSERDTKNFSSGKMA